MVRAQIVRIMAQAIPPPSALQDAQSWTSSGLARGQALREWRDWAASTIAPIEVEVFDTEGFAARWASHGIGQLRLLHLHAPAQRVTHTGDASTMRAAPSIQLVYARHGALKTAMGGRRFTVEPGQFVLLDNTRFYQMEMATTHECIDLMMPQGWLERRLPDPQALLARPVDTRQGWAAPLGALLETLLAGGLDDAPLPRPLIAEQIGSLLALACGFHEAEGNSRHRGQLARRILGRIESAYADPDISPESVAAEAGISKRYLQALLAGSGTSFVAELNAVRLDRASELLGHPAARGLSVAEVAYRSGFLDPGYFTRLFRKRFGITPREWRAGHAPQS